MRITLPNLQQCYWQLLRSPLQNLLQLAWLAGLLAIARVLWATPEQWPAILALPLNALLGFYLLRYFARPAWLFIPVLTCLAALLFSAHAMGFQALWQLTLLVTLAGILLPETIPALTRFGLGNPSQVRGLALLLTHGAALLLILDSLSKPLSAWLLFPTLLPALFSLLLPGRPSLPALRIGYLLLCLTLGYFIASAQLHSLSAYLRLGHDLQYSRMLLSVALGLMLLQLYRPRWLAGQNVSPLTLLLCLAVYAQLLLVKSGPLPMLHNSVLASLALLLVWRYEPVRKDRAMLASLSLAYSLHLAARWLWPHFSPALHWLTQAASLFVLQQLLRHWLWPECSQPLQRWLLRWLQISVLAAHAALLWLYPELLQNTFTVALLMVCNWLLYYWRQERFWHVLSILASLYLWHVWHFLLPWPFTLSERLQIVMLQTSLLLILQALWAGHRRHWQPARSIQVVALTGLLEWLLWLFSSSSLAPPVLFVSLGMGLGYAASAGMAMALHPSNQRLWHLLLTLGLGFVSIRLSLMGWAPLQAVDLGASLLASVLLYLFSLRQPYPALGSSHTLFAWATILLAPLFLPNWQVALCWLFYSALQLWQYSHSRRKSHITSSVLLLCSSVYLWMPRWLDQQIILQLYVLPTALALLGILHLHRQELKPSLHHQLRLALVSILYVGAGIDLFINASFAIFLLSLGLGMAGIVVGISLKVRAFLYSGSTFVVLTIAGQLLQFYPEQRLGKALVLMGFGASITVAMILFNMKRQAIIARINSLKYHLQSWQ